MIICKEERAMKRISRLMIGLILLSLMVFLSSVILAQDEAIKAELPVVITSCGQSPGPMKLKVFMNRLKFDHEYNLQVSAADLVAKKEADTPFKSLIIVTGASLKGMGAAGVDIDDELERIKGLIAEAKKQKILVIGAHIEGMARRAQGAAPGDNTDEISIDAVCPESDLLIVRKDGNEDGRFTTISKEKNIPLIEFEKNMELAKVLKDLFEE